jgi:hypothetical protein
VMHGQGRRRGYRDWSAGRGDSHVHLVLLLVDDLLLPIAADGSADGRGNTVGVVTKPSQFDGIVGGESFSTARMQGPARLKLPSQAPRISTTRMDAGRHTRWRSRRCALNGKGWRVQHP